MKIVRTKTPAETARQFLNLWVGDQLIDHAGRPVEKVSETDVAVGAGYNAFMPIRQYLAAIHDRTLRFGKYLLPA